VKARFRESEQLGFTGRLPASTWGIERFEIDKGLDGPHEAAVHFFFPSTDTIGAAMGADGTGAIMADIAN
jgi:hypothetical protein